MSFSNQPQKILSLFIYSICATLHVKPPRRISLLHFNHVNFECWTWWSLGEILKGWIK